MSNPLSNFAIEPLLSLNIDLFNIHLSLTNNSFYLLISSALLVLLLVSISAYGNLVPSNIGILGESLYSSILNMSRNSSNNQTYMPLLISLFGIILFANLVSNIPFNYASTSAVSFTLGLSLTIFIGVTLLAISLKGWSFLATFVPANTPNALLPLLVLIELVSYLARAISLGVRLFANMVAGHALLTIISSMTNKILTSSVYGILLAVIPLVLLILLVGLEIAVAFIQAYVFTILTSIYIDEAIKPLV